MTRDSAAGEPRLGLTVRRLLAEPQFRLRLVAGAGGLDRPVRWAHSTELLDPGPYLRGHELVLTVGASLSTRARCEVFARSVNASRASAIGYGIGDVTPDAPEALRAECERLGLPLFEVPPEVPFVTFTEWLAERLAAIRGALHGREEAGRLLELVGDGLASPEAVRQELRSVGLAPDPLVAAAMNATAVPDSFDLPPGVLLGIAGDAALLVAADERDPAELAGAWSASCGIGGPGPLSRLPQSLSEARAALDLARRRRGIVRARDLATFPALLGRLKPDQVEPFLEQIARPLAAYDSAHGTRLIETLRTFIDSGGSVGTAARALYLHPNTLRHRLSRIEALTGRNPLLFEDRVALAVALWTWTAHRH